MPSYPFLSHLLSIIPTISPPFHPTFMLHQTRHHFHFYHPISITSMALTHSTTKSSFLTQTSFHSLSCACSPYACLFSILTSLILGGFTLGERIMKDLWVYMQQAKISAWLQRGSEELPKDPK